MASARPDTITHRGTGQARRRASLDKSQRALTALAALERQNKKITHTVSSLRPAGLASPPPSATALNTVTSVSPPITRTPGSFTTGQRTAYHQDTLPAAWITQLEALGMGLGDENEAAWQANLTTAEAFHAVHGHLAIPATGPDGQFLADKSSTSPPSTSTSFRTAPTGTANATYYAVTSKPATTPPRYAGT